MKWIFFKPFFIFLLLISIGSTSIAQFGPTFDPGCDPGCPLVPGCPPQCIPIDGGLGLLIAAGIGVGLWRRRREIALSR